MKNLFTIAIAALLSLTASADNDAVYAWINGQSTCYKLEDMPTVTYSTEEGVEYVHLTLDGKTEPELSLALETDEDELVITYGEYVTMTTKINKYGLTTFSYDKPVKFLSGARPYTITADYENNVLTVTPISNDIVPAYNGVLLKGTVANAEVQFTILAENPTDLLTNDLKPTTTPEGLATNDNGCYVLSGNTFGSYKAGYAFTANKAYLPKPTGGMDARTFTIVWADDDTTTAITSAQESKVQQNGKYIYGGRLVIIKDGKQYDANGNRIQ